MIRALAALAVALTACGGGQKPTEPAAPAEPATAEPAPAADAAPPALDYFVQPLETDDDLIPALKIGAEQLDCALTAEEGQKVVYECPDAIIVIVQQGAELRYVCERVEAEACQQLMSRIVQAVLDAAAG